MPLPTRFRLRALCRQRIRARRHSLPAPCLPPESRLVRTVQANLANGRLERLTRAARSDHIGRSTRRLISLADYVDRVLWHLSREQTRVDSLARGDPGEWQRLRDFLARRASCLIERFAGRARAAEAYEFADEACRIIFEKPYPFDVPFDAWSTTILNHLVMARWTRSPDALDHGAPVLSLDAPMRPDPDEDRSLGDQLADDRSSSPFKAIEDQSVLLGAIDRLHSPAQRQVILDCYFADLSDDEISRRLGKSKQAVYNLRRRALMQLRQVLTADTVQERGAGIH